MQKVEILFALQKLGEMLTPEEEEFMSNNMKNSMKQFEMASTKIGLFKNILFVIFPLLFLKKKFSFLL